MTNKNIVIEDARIMFRNFSGEEGRFNPKGRRNFCVLIDPDIVEDLLEDGWNIKYLQPKDDDGEPLPYLQVSVAFGKIPPKIFLIKKNGKIQLEEDYVSILDWVEIDNVDLTIRPYNWEVNGMSGTKAYLRSMYITCVEDDFESKYYDVPDIMGTPNED